MVLLCLGEVKCECRIEQFVEVKLRRSRGLPVVAVANNSSSLQPCCCLFERRLDWCWEDVRGSCIREKVSSDYVRGSHATFRSPAECLGDAVDESRISIAQETAVSVSHIEAVSRLKR